MLAYAVLISKKWRILLVYNCRFLAIQYYMARSSDTNCKDISYTLGCGVLTVQMSGLV